MKSVEIPWQSDLYQQEVALRDEVLRAPLGLGFTPEQLAAEKDELRFGVVDQQQVDQQLIACVLVKPLSSTVAKLRQMAVAPDRQREGVGATLIWSVEKSLADRGYEVIEMNAREVVMGFYQSLGYTSVGERFVEVGIPHFKMSKQIGHENKR